MEEAEERSRICIREILESTGTTWEQAENAASTIQATVAYFYIQGAEILIIINSDSLNNDDFFFSFSFYQAAFRNHYEDMLAREARGEVQWQRAVVNTMSILRRAGVSQEEAAKAVTLIQVLITIKNCL